MTYLDECIERSEKASSTIFWEKKIHGKAKHPPLWHCMGPNTNSKQAECDAEFICHARKDVPNLAKRLKKAIEHIRKYSGDRLDEEFANELESHS